MRFRLAVDDATIIVSNEMGCWTTEFYWPDGSCAWYDAWKGDKHVFGTEKAAKEEGVGVYRFKTGHLKGKRARWIEEKP